MHVSCTVFSGPVEDVVFSDDQSSATATCVKRVCTPCGSLDFPPGSRVHFSRIQFVPEIDIFFPVSGGSITLVKKEDE